MNYIEIWHKTKFPIKSVDLVFVDGSKRNINLGMDPHVKAGTTAFKEIRPSVDQEQNCFVLEYINHVKKGPTNIMQHITQKVEYIPLDNVISMTLNPYPET